MTSVNDASNKPGVLIKSAKTDLSGSSSKKIKTISKATSMAIREPKQLSGLPDDEAIANKTLEDIPNQEDAGEYTERLSDFTDADDGAQPKNTNAFTTWYHHFHNLTTNPRIRFYAAINFILFLLNFILLLALIVIVVYAVVIGVRAQRESSHDKPCLYEWGLWSKCSKPCRESATSALPTRSRKVNKTSIVQARGSLAKSAPCPKNIQNLVDKAPCNTHICAKNLSQFEFGEETYRRNASNSSDCYKIRKIPQADMLIHIDTTDLTQYAKCGNSSTKQV